MRTSIVSAAILGLFAAGCAGELSGTGEGGDDQTGGSICGNGTVEGSEACDDGNSANEDGCSATCTIETSTVPKLSASLDKMTINTELAKTETVTLNLLSAGGFAGPATVSASLVDGTGTAIPRITVMGPTTVDVAADATTPAQFMIVVPTDATGTAITGTLKLDVTSTAGSANLTSTVNVAPIYTITIEPGTGADDPKHPLAGKNFSVRRGTKLRMVNSDTAVHISHGGGGIPHEDQVNNDDGLPGATYEVDTTPIAPGAGKTFGCHTHDSPTYATITIL